MYFYVRPPAVLLALLGFALLCPSIGVLQLAKAQEVNCDEALTTADRSYTIGQFDNAITLLRRCLEEDAFDEAQRKEALRILGLSYVAKDRADEAREAMQRLLELVPDFQPDPVLDPPTFVKMIEEVRSEMEAAEAAQETEAEPSIVVRDQPRDDPPPVVTRPQQTQKSGIGRWLLVGGVVVAGGVAAAVLLGGSSGGDGGTIAPPPALPPIN